MKSIATETEEIVVQTEASSKSLARAISEGAVEACHAASNVIPAVGKAVRKTVYSGFYYATYGVVFSSLMIASLIPSDNAMGEGIRDGAEAARKSFDERRIEAARRAFQDRQVSAASPAPA